MFAYCDNNPVNRIDESGYLGNVAIGAIVGGAIGLFSAIARGESASNVIVATVAGAATGALCAMGAWGILAGSTLNGVATGLTALITPRTKADGIRYFMQKSWQDGNIFVFLWRYYKKIS